MFANPLGTCVRALVLIVSGLTLAACTDGPRDVRNYYFPVRDLAERGLVYVYDNTGTLPGPPQEFSYYLGVDVDTALHLAITHYDGAFEPRQQNREQVRNDGAYLEEMLLLAPDSAGRSIPVMADVLFPRTFPFYLDPAVPEAMGYRISFEPPSKAGTTNFVSLNRTFRGDTTVQVLGGRYDALVFDLAGEVSQRDPAAGDISPQFTGYEIYAKGIGLVEYRRDLSVGASLGGKLSRRVGMDDWLAELKRTAPDPTAPDDHSGHNH